MPDGREAGWDAAIIRLDKSSYRFQGVKIRRMLEHLDQDEAVVAQGARSGFVREATALHGALTACGSDDLM
jgi:hypothetical protein